MTTASKEEAAVEYVFQYFRDCFPQGLEYRETHTEAELLADYRLLCRSRLKITGGAIQRHMSGLALANAFHPEMDDVRCKGYKTPREVFNSDTLLRQTIRSRLRSGRAFTLSGFRRSIRTLIGVQRVSNFRPTAAKAIISYFRPSKVFDFCAGWSGRQLGAMSLGVPYLGIDANRVAVAGCRRLIGFLSHRLGRRFEVEVRHGCATTVLPALRGSWPLIFTSPPYHDIERYSDDPEQSYLQFPEIDDWYEGFLWPCIRESTRLLSRDGHLVLNVNPDMADRTEGLATRAGLVLAQRWLMELSKHNYMTRIQGVTKAEPILVFRHGR
jgi:hypothetical protein